MVIQLYIILLYHLGKIYSFVNSKKNTGPIKLILSGS